MAVKWLQDDASAKRLFWLLAGCVSLFWGAVIVSFGATPSEDAFILFRYSENLATGHGIVWNPGEQPVEGATDFLWMALVALLTVLLADAVLAARLLGAGFVVATLVLFHWFFRRRMQLPFGVFAVVSLCYLATPVPVHAANGFSPPMFSFLLLASTALLLLATRDPGDFRGLLWWALAMLLTGLTRPEGNLFNFCLICSYLLMNRARLRSVLRPAATAWALGYVLPGLVFFLWRAQHFGLPWPLPFYVKGLYSGSRLGVFATNAELVGAHILPPCLLLLATLAFPRGAKGASAAPRVVAGAVLLFLAFYMFMLSSQNVVYRFEYPAYVLLLFLAAVRLGEWLRLGRVRNAVVCSAAFAVATLWFTVSAIPIPDREDDTISLGRDIRRHAGKGYALATTEAGRLPFYSSWRTLDSYGLNDPVIALGGFDYAHWQLYSPQLVLIHPTADWDVYAASVPPTNGGGNRRLLMEFMRRDSVYELAAVVQRIRRRGDIRPGDYNLYFLARDFEDYADVKQRLQNIPGAIQAEIPAGVAGYVSGEAPEP